MVAGSGNRQKINNTIKLLNYILEDEMGGYGVLSKR